MSVPNFKSTEVAELYDEIKNWSHAEYPFLDPKYSPGSYAPAIDLTPYVTTWLASGQEEAIAELWSFLTPSGNGYTYSLKKALQARLPDWIQVSETARLELHAIFILTLRAALIANQDMSNIGTRLAATTLACRQIAIDPALINDVIRFANLEPQ